MRPLTTVEEARFWPKVSGGNFTECWPWIAGKFDTGYGAFSIDQQNRGAHCVAYELLVAPVPDGLHLDHLCHDHRTCTNDSECPHRGCVNPWHLDPVPPRVNNERGGSISALNIVKTHCPQGHEYAGDNLLRYSGRRACRTCEKAKQARYRDRLRAHRPPRLTCRAGHPTDLARTSPAGIRVCRECERGRKQRWKARRALSALLPETAVA